MERPWDEELVGRRLVILSWDVHKAKRALAWWVNGLVYGRRVTVPVNGHERTYTYPGYVDAPGVLRLGQSVLLMPPGIAKELGNALAARDIVCTVTEGDWRVGGSQQ